MWAGYAEALVRYGLEMCAVWSAGGRADTCATSLVVELAERCGLAAVRTEDQLAAAGELPPWLGRADFHRSHQASLLRKDPDWYGRFFAGVDADLPYVWPASDRSTG
jgi:hypothetical protein